MHVAVGDETRGGVDDGLGRGEIGLTDFHVDDVAPLGFELARAAQQLHDVEGLDVLDAARTLKHLCDPLWGSRASRGRPAFSPVSVV